MTDAAKVMDDFVYGIIDRKEKPGGEDSGDLLSAYMALRDDDGEPLSRQFHRLVARTAPSNTIKLTFSCQPHSDSGMYFVEPAYPASGPRLTRVAQ